jgi:hypothetical protein
MKKAATGQGSRAKLREYFEAHVGKVLNSDTLRAVAGTSEWARRVRELRQLEGMNIQTFRDNSNLKPDEYKLVSLKRMPVFESAISKEMRAFVLERNGFICQNCGVAAGEEHPYDRRRVVLHIGHIIDASKGGPSDDPSNLRALCSVCNEGVANIGPMRPDLKHLLINVRRAKGTDQLEVLKFLMKKYPAQAAEFMENEGE